MAPFGPFSMQPSLNRKCTYWNYRTIEAIGYHGGAQRCKRPKAEISARASRPIWRPISVDYGNLVFMLFGVSRLTNWSSEQGYLRNCGGFVQLEIVVQSAKPSLDHEPGAEWQAAGRLNFRFLIDLAESSRWVCESTSWQFVRNRCKLISSRKAAK
jgi:hypothetical protein